MLILALPSAHVQAASQTQATIFHLSKILNSPCSSARSFPGSQLHRSTTPCLTHGLSSVHSEWTVVAFALVRFNCCHKMLETGWLKWQKFIFSKFWRLKVQNRSVRGSCWFFSGWKGVERSPVSFFCLSCSKDPSSTRLGSYPQDLIYHSYFLKHCASQ